MSLSSRRTFLTLAATPLLLAGCGFTPIYGEGTTANAMYGKIALAPFEGQTGFDMRERLESRLGIATDPQFLLGVDLRINRKGLAITPDGSITRYNLKGIADFTVERSDGTVVYSDTVEAFTAYNATGTAYATRVAARDAHRRLVVTLADKIVTLMAISAREWLP